MSNFNNNRNNYAPRVVGIGGPNNGQLGGGQMYSSQLTNAQRVATTKRTQTTDRFEGAPVALYTMAHRPVALEQQLPFPQTSDIAAEDIKSIVDTTAVAGAIFSSDDPRAAALVGAGQGLQTTITTFAASADLTKGLADTLGSLVTVLQYEQTERVTGKIYVVGVGENFKKIKNELPGSKDEWKKLSHTFVPRKQIGDVVALDAFVIEANQPPNPTKFIAAVLASCTFCPPHGYSVSKKSPLYESFKDDKICFVSVHLLQCYCNHAKVDYSDVFGWLTTADELEWPENVCNVRVIEGPGFFPVSKPAGVKVPHALSVTRGMLSENLLSNYCLDGSTIMSSALEKGLLQRIVVETSGTTIVSAYTVEGHVPLDALNIKPFSTAALMTDAEDCSKTIQAACDNLIKSAYCDHSFGANHTIATIAAVFPERGGKHVMLTADQTTGELMQVVDGDINQVIKEYGTTLSSSAYSAASDLVYKVMTCRRAKVDAHVAMLACALISGSPARIKSKCVRGLMSNSGWSNSWKVVLAGYNHAWQSEIVRECDRVTRSIANAKRAADGAKTADSVYYKTLQSLASLCEQSMVEGAYSLILGGATSFNPLSIAIRNTSVEAVARTGTSTMKVTEAVLDDADIISVLSSMRTKAGISPVIAVRAGESFKCQGSVIVRADGKKTKMVAFTPGTGRKCPKYSDHEPLIDAKEFPQYLARAIFSTTFDPANIDQFAALPAGKVGTIDFVHPSGDETKARVASIPASFKRNGCKPMTAKNAVAVGTSALSTILASAASMMRSRLDSEGLTIKGSEETLQIVASAAQEAAENRPIKK